MIVLINMVIILMMSAKLATPGLCKTKVFWKKGYDVIISLNDVTNKTSSRDQNYIVDVVMWPKSSISNSFLVLVTPHCKQLFRCFVVFPVRHVFPRNFKFKPKYQQYGSLFPEYLSVSYDYAVKLQTWVTNEVVCYLPSIKDDVGTIRILLLLNFSYETKYKYVIY